MNSKRSIWKLLAGVAAMGLFVTNCTVKTGDDGSCGTVGSKLSGCTCTGNSVGYQVCRADGTFGSCVCGVTDNGGASNGGASGGTSQAGASNGGGDHLGGSGATDAGAGGSTDNAGTAEGGAAGIVTDPNDCIDCLTKLCAPEWDACAREDEKKAPDPVDHPNDYCFSSMSDGSGQIEKILDCITTQRAAGLVKRDALRACGTSLGSSANPNAFAWPPPLMTATTAGVLNCMADAPDETEPGTWADSSNVPPGGTPAPWLAMTCAKLSCTSAQ